jgi:hypothetical protein
MKLTIKLFILLTFVIIFANSLLLKRNGVKEDFTTAWTSLFTSIVRPPQQCNPPDNFIKQGPLIDDDADLKIPKKKDNPFAKEQGFGDSAYLWDYLDAVIHDDMMTEIKKMYDDAMAIAKPDEKVFPDPYSLEKLIFYYSQGKEDTLNKGEDELLKTVAVYNKNFIADIWKKSVSVPQVYSIFQNWGWYQLPVQDNPRKSVNYFDFNGDGRLSAYEFIIFAIVNNKKVIRKETCKTHCFSEISKSKLDPLFAFVDCDGDGWINSENMWLGLQNLKRAEGWDIYQCALPNSINSQVRTTSMNDFILKNYKKANGYVNLDEWRRGFILGYNDRNVNDSVIYDKDDTKNKKEQRWSTDGKTDLQCEKIKKMMPSGDGSGSTLNNGTPKQTR